MKIKYSPEHRRILDLGVTSGLLYLSPIDGQYSATGREGDSLSIEALTFAEAVAASTPPPAELLALAFEYEAQLRAIVTGNWQRDLIRAAKRLGEVEKVLKPWRPLPPPTLAEALAALDALARNLGDVSGPGQGPARDALALLARVPK